MGVLLIVTEIIELQYKAGWFEFIQLFWGLCEFDSTQLSIRSNGYKHLNSAMSTMQCNTIFWSLSLEIKKNIQSFIQHKYWRNYLIITWRNANLDFNGVTTTHNRPLFFFWYNDMLLFLSTNAHTQEGYTDQQIGIHRPQRIVQLTSQQPKVIRCWKFTSYICHMIT